MVMYRGRHDGALSRTVLASVRPQNPEKCNVITLQISGHQHGLKRLAKAKKTRERPSRCHSDAQKLDAHKNGDAHQRQEVFEIDAAFGHGSNPYPMLLPASAKPSGAQSSFSSTGAF